MKLGAVVSIGDPGAVAGDVFTGRDGGGGANNGDEGAVATGFDAEYTESRLFTMESDAFDRAGKMFRRGARCWCLFHVMHPLKRYNRLILNAQYTHRIDYFGRESEQWR